MSCGHITCSSRDHALRDGGRYFDTDLHRWVCFGFGCASEEPIEVLVLLSRAGTAAADAAAEEYAAEARDHALRDGCASSERITLSRLPLATEAEGVARAAGIEIGEVEGWVRSWTHRDGYRCNPGRLLSQWRSVPRTFPGSRRLHSVPAGTLLPSGLTIDECGLVVLS